MLGFVAAVLFAIAFIINAASVSVSNAIFAPTSLMLLGLVCLALHLSGVGTGWRVRRSPAAAPDRKAPRRGPRRGAAGCGRRPPGGR